MKMPEPKPMLIAGADVPCEAGIAPLLSINPATGQTNYEVAAAGPETVDFAVRNAASACADRGWREMLPMQRARILLGIADGIERDGAMLARLQMQENGKVWRECSRQVQSAAATFRYYAGVCEVTGSEVTRQRRHPQAIRGHAFHRTGGCAHCVASGAARGNPECPAGHRAGCGCGAGRPSFGADGVLYRGNRKWQAHRRNSRQKTDAGGAGVGR